jgi:hypothetical protein
VPQFLNLMIKDQVKMLGPGTIKNYILRNTDYSKNISSSSN